MMVSLSGDCSHPNGVVFDLPQTAFVMYPALSTSVEGHLRANLGHSPFKYAAPSQEYVAFALFGAVWADCVTSKHAVAVEAAAVEMERYLFANNKVGISVGQSRPCFRLQTRYD
jgi:hypothetical protein